MTMLDKILKEMVDMHRERLPSHNRSLYYSGYGTTIDRMVEEYWEIAGFTPDTRRMIRHLDRMAYARAVEEQETQS